MMVVIKKTGVISVIMEAKYVRGKAVQLLGMNSGFVLRRKRCSRMKGGLPLSGSLRR